MYEYRDVEHRGDVKRLSYEYTVDGEQVQKYVNVYVPYGYEEETPLDIMYMMHGGGGNPDAWMDASQVKNMLDRMIEEQKMRPVICVFPSYYPGKIRPDRHMDRDYDRNLTKAFAKELKEAVMPLVEGEFSTFAMNDLSMEGFVRSREHRAFTGFSMGACTTWFMFLEASDVIKNFLPLSGDCWALESQGGGKYPEKTAELLKEHVVASGMKKEDFLIYGATGTADIAYEPMKAQMEAMEKLTDVFDASESGNFKFYVEEGQRHSYEAVNRYLETLLPNVFPVN